jgi:Arc/MetJ-type ribon-helix-helix transcriptional regulator
MKVKTSVTLSRETIRKIDRLAGRSGNRSAVIERAVEALATQEARRQRDARDLEILNRDSDRLEEEAEEVLEYQEQI